jgi:hypothetical protein
MCWTPNRRVVQRGCRSAVFRAARTNCTEVGGAGFGQVAGGVLSLGETGDYGRSGHWRIAVLRGDTEGGAGMSLRESHLFCVPRGDGLRDQSGQHRRVLVPVG